MVVVRILWVRHGNSLSQLLRSLGPTFFSASNKIPDPGLTRVERMRSVDRGRQMFAFAPRIRAIFCAAAMRSVQTAHCLRRGFPEPTQVALYVGPYLAETSTLPEHTPLLMDHPMETFTDYIEHPSYVDPLLFRTGKKETDKDVLGGNFLRGREWMFQTMLSEGLLQMGETVVGVTHSCHLFAVFGIYTRSLDVVEEWVELDPLGRTRTLQIRAFSANTPPDKSASKTGGAKAWSPGTRKSSLSSLSPELFESM